MTLPDVLPESVQPDHVAPSLVDVRDQTDSPGDDVDVYSTVNCVSPDRTSVMTGGELLAIGTMPRETGE
ncbi:unannotated protein [freshwater metagenome]|uniref:Unannotated protein n=1 Tax=freshwater metagenome TaxID=449393 RepID=A0A6J7HVM1_9ZZZZ